MKYILTICFLIVVFNTIGQKVTCLEDKSVFENRDSSITIFRGNLILIQKDYSKETITTLKAKTKFTLSDSYTGKEYVFIDSLQYSNGWLINDKTRSRISYINQETIFVYNSADKKCLINERKNCGFDVFTWNKTTCGYTNPCYNYEYGSISIKENKFLNRNTSLIVDTEMGIIRKE